jgi:predicted Zn-dependent protease
MPAYPPLPGNVQTIGYSEDGRLHVDVIVDHVVVQTVSLDLRRLIEHCRMIADEAARRPAVQLDPAALASTSATTNPHYWPAKEG